MSDNTTIARPYAKALFEHALSTKTLAEWSELLTILAHAVLTDAVTDFVENPETTLEQQSELLLSLFEQAKIGEEREVLMHFIALLAENKRVLILPDIHVQYAALREQHEKTLAVEVISFSPLTPTQEEKLTQSLSQRLQRQITLDVTIDKSLLGGAIVRAGDLVIDGSVRGKLNKLGSDLALH